VLIGGVAHAKVSMEGSVVVKSGSAGEARTCHEMGTVPCAQIGVAPDGDASSRRAFRSWYLDLDGKEGSSGSSPCADLGTLVGAVQSSGGLYLGEKPFADLRTAYGGVQSYMYPIQMLHANLVDLNTLLTGSTPCLEMGTAIADVQHST